MRRAKHSSMMVLYHLHNPDAPAFSCSCNACGMEIEPGQGFRCSVCPDFDMCTNCKHTVGHQHQLVVRTQLALAPLLSPQLNVVSELHPACIVVHPPGALYEPSRHSLFIVLVLSLRRIEDQSMFSCSVSRLQCMPSESLVTRCSSAVPLCPKCRHLRDTLS